MCLSMTIKQLIFSPDVNVVAKRKKPYRRQRKESLPTSSLGIGRYRDTIIPLRSDADEY